MNILYIHTHDSGRVLSPYGYKVPTPAIEKFAGEAAVFRNAYCVGPTCSPSRAGLLTGTYPHQNGMLGLSQERFFAGLWKTSCTLFKLSWISHGFMWNSA